MITPEQVASIVESNPEAQAVLDAVGEVVQRVITATRGRPDAEVFIEDASCEIISAVLSAPYTGRASPPWTPPRYRLPPERGGVTKKLEIYDYATQKDVELYITLNFYDDDKPAELFVTKPSEAHSTIGALMDALAIVLSIALQYGVEWETFARKLERQTFPPYGTTKDRDQEFSYVSSVLDYVIRWAEKETSRRRNIRKEKSNCTEDTSTSSDDAETSSTVS